MAEYFMSKHLGNIFPNFVLFPLRANQKNICWKTFRLLSFHFYISKSIVFSKGKINPGQFFNVHNQTTATQTVSGRTPSSTQIFRSVSRSFVANVGREIWWWLTTRHLLQRAYIMLKFAWSNISMAKQKEVFSALLILLNDRHQVGVEGPCA